MPVPLSLTVQIKILDLFLKSGTTSITDLLHSIYSFTALQNFNTSLSSSENFIEIYPYDVNFNALDIKLNRTYFILNGSLLQYYVKMRF